MNNMSTGMVALMLLAVAVAIPLILWVWRKASVAKKEAEVNERAEREKEEQGRLQQQVRAGTHDVQGYRLCITCSDKTTRATQPAFLVEQSEGVMDLVKRRFGAPSRYNIQQVEHGVNVYCDQCATLVNLEHQDFTLRFENKLREQRRDAALELRRWVKYGVNDVVARRIEEHDEQVRSQQPDEKRPNVIPLVRSSLPE